MGCDFYSRISLYIEYVDGTYEFNDDIDIERHYVDNSLNVDMEMDKFRAENNCEIIFEDGQWKTDLYKSYVKNIDISKVKQIQIDTYINKDNPQ